jgi:hypothetical protein
MMALKVDLRSMSSTFHSVAVNLASAIKNKTPSVPTLMTPVPRVSASGQEIQKVYNSNEQRIIKESNEMYNQYLEKYKFKGLTREVFCQINIMGGFRDYMNKMYHKYISQSLKG